MDYVQAVEYLYQQLPMFQRIGTAAFKKNLENTLKLCEALGNPQEKFKSVHVGGTNGKGSSSHMLAAILQSGGYKTGLYTSPHLKEFTERIKVNGEEIRQSRVTRFVNQYKELIESIKPSFFELTVAMAFDHFATEKVDIAIIEVGLGGRLDSTNVIDPQVSLITNISYDHQQFLGDTLEEIAFEKAGIIKPQRPIVISQTQKEVKSVFQGVAQHRNASIYFADETYKVSKTDGKSPNLSIEVQAFNKSTHYELQLTADYQLKNVPGVLKVVELLNELKFKVEQKEIAQGLAKTVTLTGLKGRWQKIQDEPLIICDTGHNEDGINQVIAQLNKTQHENLFIVFGTVKDKDPSKILSALPKKARYFFCEAKIPRALPANELLQLATPHGLKGVVVEDVNDAIAQAKLLATEQDLIFVGGSTFVVAEIENL